MNLRRDILLAAEMSKPVVKAISFTAIGTQKGYSAGESNSNWKEHAGSIEAIQ